MPVSQLRGPDPPGVHRVPPEERHEARLAQRPKLEGDSLNASQAIGERRVPAEREEGQTPHGQRGALPQHEMLQRGRLQFA